VSVRALLLGSRGGGGEEVFLRGLAETPPPGVTYAMILESHASLPGARALRVRAGLYNRLVHPFLWPVPGLKAYRVRGFDLVHVHNFPMWLDVPPECPVVFSVGSGGYGHYMETYLDWTPEAVEARFRRARAIYRLLGIRSELTPARVDAVTVWSDFAAGNVRAMGVPADKVFVVPPGLEVPDVARAPRPAGPFTFVLVGRDPPRKGADLAVEAVRGLRARGLDVRLLLVGDAAYPAMGDGEGILGTGPVERTRIFGDFYAAADAALVPSRAEGMGCGLPVVAARRDALPEIVGDGGLLVEPGSVAALADAMEVLVRDPDGARARGRAARERFRRTWALDRARERLLDVYRRVGLEV
jgi:glycosyltransferase involved in cell wall biosynthesis